MEGGRANAGLQVSRWIQLGKFEALGMGLKIANAWEFSQVLVQPPSQHTL